MWKTCSKIFWLFTRFLKMPKAKDCDEYCEEHCKDLPIDLEEISKEEYLTAEILES